ncbi:hypothetical protein ACFFWD_07935 [Bradyrhizobium erythrophlei]
MRFARLILVNSILILLLLLLLGNAEAANIKMVAAVNFRMLTNALAPE